MRTPLLFALTLATAAACGKKKEEPPAAPTAAPGPAPAPTPATPASGGSAAPTPTAAGAEVKEAPKVTECPKSLAGAETVHRTITKECGRITVTEDYYVDGGSLTLEAGAVLQFKADTSISVGYNAPGKLIVKGTAEAPVTFTSGADAAPGVWEGVFLRDGADRSSVEGLVVEFAGQEGSQAVMIQAEDVVWKSSIVRDSKGGGMVVREGGRVKDFTGNTFDRTAAAPLAVEPEAVGGIGTGNKFPKDTAIDVTAGPIDQAIVWNPGVPLRVVGQVMIEGDKVKGTLEIAPGTELRFGPEGRFTVGYNNAGSLKAVGTKEAPITFTTASAKEKASWPPLGIFDKGEGTFDHGVFEYGGTEEKGVLAVSGKLSVTNCLFRENAAGVQLTEQAKLVALDGSTFEKNTAYAISAFPVHLGALGANSYDARSRIRVGRGTLNETQTWKAQATVVELQEQVLVEGKNVLTIEAGAQFEVRDSVELSVGYGDAASLRLLGTAEKPVVFAGVRHEPGAWKGIVLYDNSRDCVFDNVVVKDAVKGLDFRGPATGKVTGMVCANCSEAALSYACDSKVEVKAVKAEGGAAKGELKPDCPK
jgi:hypothetical protein